MVAPSEAIEAVARSIAESGNLPDNMGLVLHEADQESEDADVDLPALEIEIDENTRVYPNNTDLAGWTTDSDGNRTGRIYHSEYELSIQMDIWTSANDSYDPNKLGQALRSALHKHSSYGPQEPFFDENGNELDEIYRFVIDEGSREDDVIQTPTLRRWRQNIELWAYEEFVTSEDYILNVVYPTDGDFNDADGDGVISDT